MRRLERGTRSAITLLELLLVLALLAVIGSIAVPAIFSGFSSVRLRRGGDQVLASWSAVRARAIETGQIHEFRYERDTGNYRIRPQAIGESASAGVQQTSLDEPIDVATAQQLAAPGEDASDVREFLRLRTLPEPLKFQQGQLTAATSREGAYSGQHGWSQPIWFFPEGAATDASVVLANDRDGFVRITLRGLTGVGRTSGVLTHGELDRQKLAR